MGKFISFKIFLLRWHQWYDKTISGIRQFILITFISCKYFNIVKGISDSVWTFLLILNFDSITLIYCLFILSQSFSSNCFISINVYQLLKINSVRKITIIVIWTSIAKFIKLYISIH